MATASIKATSELFIESDMSVAESIAVSAGNVVVLCRRCPGKIEPNDDSAAVVQTSRGAVVLIAADGVGGSPAGHKASAIAVESVAQYVEEAEATNDLRPAILDGIELANREILDLGIGAATTLAVVEIQNQIARAYQVGDSTTMVIGQRGALKWKSTSHSPVGYAVESGMLEEADAMHHDERHIVSNLVGSRDMHIDIGPRRRLAPRDTVIVGSDGLFDNLHLNEVIEGARLGKPLHRVMEISDLATSRMTGSLSDVPGKPDDLTILLFTSR